MSNKPRKAFDGIGRPQGWIDDAAKVALRAAEKVADEIGRLPIRAKTKVNPTIRKHIKSFPKFQQKTIKDLYLGPKKGTYGNPYSAKAAPKMEPFNRQQFRNELRQKIAYHRSGGKKGKR